MESIISVKNISKSFGPKKVLDKVSFEIEKGNIFGLLGSNGAGKSTITRIMLGLEKQSSGEVKFFGKNTNLRSRVALVPQDTAFYSDFTVSQNMNFFAGISGIKGKAMRERQEFLLNWLNLKDFKNTRAGFLSGGYQRLLNIALSLLNDPEIIFFDEPTVGLDPNMRKMFWEKIASLKEGGKTIILTTHYMDEAEHLCDKIVLLKNGSLLAIGSPQELILTHGGIKVMIIETDKEVLEADAEKIKTVLNEKTVAKKGNYLFIPLHQEHSLEKTLAVVQWMMNKGYSIKSSTTKEPALDDVFLNLTGEKMVNPK